MQPVCSQHNPDFFFQEEGTELCAGSSIGKASISDTHTHSALNRHTVTHLQTDVDK